MSEDIIILIDGSDVIAEANEAAARAFSLPPDQITGKSIHDGILHCPAFIDHARIDEARHNGHAIQFEAVEGGRRFEVRVQPVSPDPGVTGMIGLHAHDVTEQKRVEAKLRKAEITFRNVYENAAEGMFQMSPEGKLLSANAALAHMHGYGSPEELLALVPDITDLYADPSRRRELISLIWQEGYIRDFEARMRRKDGRIIWVSISARAVYDAEGRMLYREGMIQDITGRKEAEEALRESEERYRTAIEHSNDAVCTLSQGIHIYVNHRFVEMFGYTSPEEIEGASYAIIVHPDDLERITDIIARRGRKEPAPTRYEFKAVTKKGDVIPVEVSSTTIMHRGKELSFVYLRDVTERRRAEEALIASRNELERLNRAKSKAMAHISHELTTPLALIGANVRILERKLKGTVLWNDLEKSTHMLERNVERICEISDESNEIIRTSLDLEAVGAADDVDRLVQRMEGLSKVPHEILEHARALKEWLGQHLVAGRGGFQVLELYPFVLAAVESTRYLSKKRDLRIATEMGEDPLYVSMNPAVLREVLDGLLKNAVENTPDGGSIQVRMEDRHGLVWIDVSDTGVGITEQNQAYIFDGLFHTTETELYCSGRPYEFGAGGKGLDLLKLKVYATTFGFELMMQSWRCVHIPTDRDVCPGNIASCTHVQSGEECAASGGSRFSIGLLMSSEKTALMGGDTPLA